MRTTVRTLGFTNSLQRLIWTSGDNTSVTAYLWGAGGGGGGNDSGIGGTGGGGGFTEVTFSVNNGDVIDVAVGGGGGGGASGRGSAPGGAGGASYTLDTVFNSRTAPASPPVVPSTNSAYVSFLNTYGVWVNPISATFFDRTYTVNFPVTGNYTFVSSCDNYGTIFLDGAAILDVPGFGSTYSTVRTVSSGIHQIRMYGVNTGGPGSMALTVNGGSSYSGGRGGTAGPAGSSGGGGGGGGATVIFKNGVPLAVAAGGGGGGGGGNVGTRNGDNAPGSAGQAAVGVTAGQNGQDKSGDGGGGGAGGGGLGGGNGGAVRSGDQAGFAGSFGLSSSPFQNPNGAIPGGRNNINYVGSAGTGGPRTGSGSAGLAVLSFDTPGIHVNDGTAFQPINKVWVKVNNIWQEVKSTYIKDGGIWKPVLGSTVPEFVQISGNFGTAPRPY
jgi:hypothetical protein